MSRLNSIAAITAITLSSSAAIALPCLFWVDSEPCGTPDALCSSICATSAIICQQMQGLDSLRDKWTCHEDNIHPKTLYECEDHGEKTDCYEVIPCIDKSEETCPLGYKCLAANDPSVTNKTFDLESTSCLP